MEENIEESRFSIKRYKFEVSILINSCGDIFDEKSGEKEKGTDTRKNK